MKNNDYLAHIKNANDFIRISLEMGELSWPKILEIARIRYSINKKEADRIFKNFMATTKAPSSLHWMR